MTNVWRRATAGGALLAALLTLGACGSGGAGREDPGVDQPVSPAPAKDGQQRIGEENMGHIWPLSVPEGTIECREPDQAVFTAPDGKTYALNDRAAQADYPSVEPLRAEGADGGKISLGALRSKAMALCSASGQQ